MDKLEYIQIFAVFLTFAAFFIGEKIYKLTRHFPLCNPSIIGMIIIIGTLSLLDIDYDTYNSGGQFFTLLLLPTTAALAIPIYRQRATLKKYLLPILIGTAVGSFCGIGSVWLMCKFFAYDSFLNYSMLSKSVTTPIAMELTRLLGGEVSIILICVTIAGIAASFYVPLFLKLFKIKNPVAAGIATGTASHGFGTGVVMEINQEMGAMSGLAIGISGLFTVLYGVLLPW